MEQNNYQNLPHWALHENIRQEALNERLRKENEKETKLLTHKGAKYGEQDGSMIWAPSGDCHRSKHQI